LCASLGRQRAATISGWELEGGIQDTQNKARGRNLKACDDHLQGTCNRVKDNRGKRTAREYAGQGVKRRLSQRCAEGQAKIPPGTLVKPRRGEEFGLSWASGGLPELWGAKKGGRKDKGGGELQPGRHKSPV